MMGTFIADLVLQILSFVAETERENIRHRQAEGISAAKAKGVRFGCPRHPLPDHLEQLLHLWTRGFCSTEEILFLCHISASTFYRRRKEFPVKINQQSKGIPFDL